MSKEKVVELMGQPAFIENKYVDRDLGATIKNKLGNLVFDFFILV